MTDIREREELDRALDALVRGDAAAPSSPLLDLARELRVALPLEVSASARKEHLAMITGVPPVSSRSRIGRRIALTGLAAAIAVSLLSSTALAASSSALPGDRLFGVKRTFERIGMSMHRGRESRTAYAFAIVQRRLAELRTASHGDGRRAERARVAYENALAEADRLLGTEADINDVLLSHVEEELQKHVAVLSDLLTKVPEEARPGIQRAIDNASKAEEHAARGHSTHQPGDTPRGRSTNRAPRSTRSHR
jgi:hypothetical protein